MLCDYVLGGMKCGITDSSAGASYMVDGSRVGFYVRRFDWYQEPGVVWPAGEDAALR